MRNRKLLVAAWVIAWSFTWASAFAATDLDQNQQKTPPGQDVSLKDIEDAIKDIDQKIAKSKTLENKQNLQQIGITAETDRERLNLYAALKSAYEELITTTRKTIDYQKDESNLREKLTTQQQTGMAQKPPYSLSLYNTLLDGLAETDKLEETLKIEIESVKGDIDTIKNNAKKFIRQLNEQLEINKKRPLEEQSSILKWRIESLRLSLQLQEIFEKTERKTLENLALEKKLNGIKKELFIQQISWVRQHLQLEDSDMEKWISEIENEKKQIAKRIKKLSSAKNAANQAWLKAQKTAEAVDKQLAPLLTEAELKRTESWKKTYQQMIEQSQDMIRLLDHRKSILKIRYELLKSEMAQDDIIKWADDIEQKIKSLGHQITLEQTYLNSLLKQIETIEQRIAKESATGTLLLKMNDQIASLRKRSDYGMDLIAALLSAQQQDHHFLNELKLKTDRTPVASRLAELKNQFDIIWNFEVWVIDTNSVTIRKLVIAFGILIVGMIIAKFLLRIVGYQLHKNLHIRETTASTIQKLLLYFSYLMVLLLALKTVNIPLAAFAFVGGAVVIGLGFGAQNLISNFISGFIIMAEQPINIGDLMEVDGILGKVEEIGARSTRIRTGANIHILVPNSSFLEKNITNWTLADNKIRAGVRIGVAYGSDVEKVKELLLKAAESSPNILTRPLPFVVFGDFGDNALIFDVYFWIQIQAVMERRIIESNIRYKINELFRKAEIVVAYPQRDVHIFAEKPLEITLQRPQERAVDQS